MDLLCSCIICCLEVVRFLRCCRVVGFLCHVGIIQSLLDYLAKIYVDREGGGWLWGSGSEGARHARARVGMTGQGDVEVEESRQKVNAGGFGPWLGMSPSSGCDFGSRVMVSSRLEVEA